MANFWLKYRGSVLGAAGAVLCGLLIIALSMQVYGQGGVSRGHIPQESPVIEAEETLPPPTTRAPEPAVTEPEPTEPETTEPEPTKPALPWYLAEEKVYIASIAGVPRGGVLIQELIDSLVPEEEEELEVPEVVVAAVDDKEDASKKDKDSDKGTSSELSLEDMKKNQEPKEEPKPTQPAPTEPAPTQPAATQPAATQPAATEPAPTEPAPTEPAQQASSGKTRAYGIDVSKWNGDINWSKVKASGVEFVIIRCGYRGNSNGAIMMDPYFRANISGALSVGLPVGIYFYSQAISVAEARQEAQWVINVIKDYKITYPVVFDYEGIGMNRIKDVTKTERSDFAIAFLNEVKKAGYTPMMYASKNSYLNSWDTDRIISSTKCKVWLAHYTVGGKPSDYSGHYDMWQYTEKGRINGTSGNDGYVDMNIAYFDKGSPAPQEAADAAPNRVDTVTAKAVDVNGDPMEGVTLLLDGTLNYTAVTGADGVAVFSEVRLDAYEVYASKAPAGYDLVDSTKREVVMGKPAASFDCGTVTVTVASADELASNMDRDGDYLIYKGTGTLTVGEGSVNIRALPEKTQPSLIIVPGGTVLPVTGKCKETGWYRVLFVDELGRTKTGYITYKPEFIASVTFIPEGGPAPTDPAPTDPAPTDPAPTEPAPTEPEGTEPENTEPESTEPESTEPEGSQAGETGEGN